MLPSEILGVVSTTKKGVRRMLIIRFTFAVVYVLSRFHFPSPSRQLSLEQTGFKFGPPFPLADRRHYLLRTNRALRRAQAYRYWASFTLASSFGEVDQAQEIACNHASHGTRGFNKHIMD